MDQLRSWQRTREAWFRKYPDADAHIKLYKKLRLKLLNEAKRQQAMWTCPKCGIVTLQINRHRDGTGRLSKHCGCRKSQTKSMTPEQLAEHKRKVMIELKRKYRRDAGQRLRVDMQAEAQAKREAIEIKRALKPNLHEAHVKRYLFLLDCRAKYAARYKANPQAEIDRQSRRKQTDVYKAQQKASRQKLPDSYVIQSLKSTGIPLEVITQRLIELKREAMQYGRLSRHTKSTIKNHLKENNETITKHP